ncbi:UPF0489 protein C5orf22 homolog [Dreissena polymorpha]|uniref:UPF0489 protein C5orf22 homolog n=1 Tax=Dreissena polymorpha TaxID=45954 RepID=UPI0022654A1C|nr:UPF0489 protein C5orf22 homolog [Dreissena polymorpha]
MAQKGKSQFHNVHLDGWLDSRLREIQGEVGAEGRVAGTPPGGQTHVDVFVVEEHHEVLPYWFDAAESGVIPKTANTLVHIDGHSDAAPVLNVPGYPFFKWPTKDQLKYLMQTNDGFIQAAAMAGFLNRVIWVWPDWDIENHEDYYNMFTISIGWTYTKTDNWLVRIVKSPDKVFCMCYTNGTDLECFSFVNLETGEEDREKGYSVPKEACIVRKLLIIEELHQFTAMKYFNNSDWATGRESVLLDIDEDFYGCTYVVDPILKTNVTLDKLWQLNDIITPVFCPVDAAQEKATDKILTELVAHVMNKKQCQTDELRKSTRCLGISKLNLKEVYTDQMSLLLMSKSISTCSYFKETGECVTKLVEFLSSMTIKQLGALHFIGFCANTSPRTYLDYREFRVCSGANTPEQSAVIVHATDEKEVRRRTIFLKHMLRNVMKRKPGLITVARSVRDGYTPRELFEQIEESVLRTLNATSDRPLRVHYDSELLGGKGGWPKAHTV